MGKPSSTKKGGKGIEERARDEIPDPPPEDPGLVAQQNEAFSARMSLRVTQPETDSSADDEPTLK